MRPLNKSLLAGALTLGIFSGCAATAQVTPEELAQVQSRLAEMERQQGRLRVRLEDTEGKIYLLQDRVEAQRLARMQDGPAPMIAQHPTYSAPPPSGPSRSRIPELPVVHVSPTAAASPAPALEPEPVEDGPEIIITQERFDAVYGGGSGGAVARAATPSAPSASARRAQPPVDTGGVRLPSASSSSAAEESVDVMDLYQEALGLFHEREYQQALGVLQRFNNSNPPESYRDNALYWMGECHYGMGEYEEALELFQRVVRDFGRGNKAADSMLKVALTLERLDRADEARGVLEALVAAHPGVPSSQRAAERLRDLD